MNSCTKGINLKIVEINLSDNYIKILKKLKENK